MTLVTTVSGTAFDTVSFDAIASGGQADLNQGNNLVSVKTAIASTPVLDIAYEGNTVSINWPASAANYVLQTTDNLTDPDWQPVAATPSLANNQLTVTLTMTTGTTQFFRLQAAP
jgi:hypothetical protein